MTGISGHIRTTGRKEINADASSPARKSTVVVVDPHQVIRLGIKALLSVEASFRLIAECGKRVHQCLLHNALPIDMDDILRAARLHIFQLSSTEPRVTHPD